MTGRIGILSVALIVYTGLSPAGGWLPAGHALQVLEAADHAELEAEISDTAVNRVALDGDRIARVMQAPGGLLVEHDPVRGDIYVRAAAPGRAAAADSGSDEFPGSEPLTLYLGTERGLTYRLSLTALERDSAQILIRNAAAAAEMARGDGIAHVDAHASELAELIGAAARNAPPPGYLIVPGPADSGPADGRFSDGKPAARRASDGKPAARSPADGGAAARRASAGGHDMPVTLIETWRGRRYRVRVLKVPAESGLDAQALAARSGAGAVAAWVSERPPDTGGVRRAAVVEMHDGAGAGR